MKVSEYNQMMAYLLRPRQKFANGGQAQIFSEKKQFIKEELIKKIKNFEKTKLFPKEKFKINLKFLMKEFNTDASTIKKILEDLPKNLIDKVSTLGIGKTSTSNLPDFEQKLFAKNYDKKTISQMATDITGLPYDNKTTKAKAAQLYRHYVALKGEGVIDDVFKGTRPKGATPKDIDGFAAYRKAQQDLINLDPKLYKNLTPNMLDNRLKKSINFSKVRGAFDVPPSLVASFEHFQGITPGTIVQDPNALRKVGITTRDFNFNVLGARAKNNIYKTIKNELRTAKESIKTGDKKLAKESLEKINKIYDDVAKKLKTVDRKKLPKYSLLKNNIKEINIKAIDLNTTKKLESVIEDYVRFVAAGPKKDVAKIKQPNLKEAIKLVKKEEDDALKKLIKSRTSDVQTGQLFANPFFDPKNILTGLGDVARVLSTPTVAATFAGTSIKENLDKGESLPEALADVEVGTSLLYPELAKRTVGQIAPRGAGILSTIGRVAANPFFGAARAFTPIGAGLTAVGLAKDAYERYQELEAMSPEQREELARERDEFSFGEFGGA